MSLTRYTQLFHSPFDEAQLSRPPRCQHAPSFNLQLTVNYPSCSPPFAWVPIPHSHSHRSFERAIVTPSPASPPIHLDTVLTDAIPDLPYLLSPTTSKTLKHTPVQPTPLPFSHFPHNPPQLPQGYPNPPPPRHPPPLSHFHPL